MNEVGDRQNIRKISLIAIILMTIVSFSNILGLKIAGLAVMVGVVFFFIHKGSEKQPFEGSGLDIGANSVLYGIIFLKTNNAWMSAISHFSANLFSIIVLVFL